MKVAFIYRGSENIGVEYLSACLKKAGHTVSLVYDPNLFDSPYYCQNKTLDWLFSYRSKLVSMTEEAKPGLIAFSVVTDDYIWACAVAEEVKKKMDVPIIFGGIHPTCLPEKVIRKPFVDYVCVGEGEEAIVALADALEGGEQNIILPNVYSKRAGEILRGQFKAPIRDLDCRPLPDKDLFHEVYKGYSEDNYTIVTSRGCPHSCSYCYNNSLRKIFGSQDSCPGRRSVGNVIDELRWAKNKYNPKTVSFYDDIFIFDKQWLREFSVCYGNEIGIPNFCFVHPLYVDKAVVSCLKEMNCTVVAMGIQSISEKIRREVLNRSESNEDIITAIRLLREAKIFLSLTFIPGLPGQNEDELEETIKFLKMYPGDHTHFLWLRYFPKTDILNIAKKRLVLTEEHIERIEDGDVSITGYTFAKDLRILVSIMMLDKCLPQVFVRFLLSRKRYKRVPSFVVTFFPFYYEQAALILFSFRKIFQGFDKVSESPMLLRGSYLMHFMVKKIMLSLRYKCSIPAANVAFSMKRKNKHCAGGGKKDAGAGTGIDS